MQLLKKTYQMKNLYHCLTLFQAFKHIPTKKEKKELVSKKNKKIHTCIIEERNFCSKWNLKERNGMEM